MALERGMEYIKERKKIWIYNDLSELVSSTVVVYTRLPWQKAIFHDAHEEYLRPADILIDL